MLWQIRFVTLLRGPAVVVTIIRAYVATIARVAEYTLNSPSKKGGWSMSRNRNVAFLVGTSLGFAIMATTAMAQSKDSDTAPIRLAYSQVFTNPMNATCRNPVN